MLFLIRFPTDQVPHLEALGTDCPDKHDLLKLINVLCSPGSLDIKQSRDICVAFAARQFREIRALVADRQPSEKSEVLQRMGHLEGQLFRSLPLYTWPTTERMTTLAYQVGKGKLRTLDFKRIKDAERDHARSLFVDEETSLPSKLALSLTSDATTAAQSATAAVSNDGGAQGDAGKGRLMTSEEKAKIREAIQKAGSMEEVRKLERMLAEGRVPEGEKA